MKAGIDAAVNSLNNELPARCLLRKCLLRLSGEGSVLAPSGGGRETAPAATFIALSSRRLGHPHPPPSPAGYALAGAGFSVSLTVRPHASPATIAYRVALA